MATEGLDERFYEELGRELRTTEYWQALPSARGIVQMLIAEIGRIRHAQVLERQRWMAEVHDARTLPREG